MPKKKRKWSDQEESYLKRYAGSKTLADLAARFDATDDELRAALARLGLTTKDGEPPRHGGHVAAADPEIVDYEAGVKALADGKLDAAGKSFERVLATTDRPHLAARARQQLAVIARRRGGGDDGGDDPFTRAVFAKNRGDHEAALAIVEKHAKKDEDGRFALLAAALHSAADREKEAIEALRRAVERDPVNRVRAYHDPDLAALRKKKDHADLFALES
ncbi:MAG TPA: hypothetical protein VHM02_02180 [Thermoanaerobaculia bacterium]|nr:hypothetical protein [Thermoanaerobaculia bacterium]